MKMPILTFFVLLLSSSLMLSESRAGTSVDSSSTSTPELKGLGVLKLGVGRLGFRSYSNVDPAFLATVQISYERAIGQQYSIYGGLSVGQNNWIVSSNSFGLQFGSRLYYGADKLQGPANRLTGGYLGLQTEIESNFYGIAGAQNIYPNHWFGLSLLWGQQLRLGKRTVLDFGLGPNAYFYSGNKASQKNSVTWGTSGSIALGYRLGQEAKEEKHALHLVANKRLLKIPLRENLLIFNSLQSAFFDYTLKVVLEKKGSLSWSGQYELYGTRNRNSYQDFNRFGFNASSRYYYRKKHNLRKGKQEHNFEGSYLTLGGGVQYSKLMTNDAFLPAHEGDFQLSSFFRWGRQFQISRDWFLDANYGVLFRSTQWVEYWRRSYWSHNLLPQGELTLAYSF